MHATDGQRRFRRGVIGLWAVLFAIWIAVNASFAPAVICAGLVVTGAIALACGRGGSVWADLRMDPRAVAAFIRFSAIFLREMVLSNIAMLRIVYARRIDIRPGIVPTHAGLTAPMGRFVLTNTVTLTPGSLVMGLEGDTLSVHVLDQTSADIDVNTAAVSGAFRPALAQTFG